MAAQTSDEVRRFLLDQIGDHPHDIVKVTVEAFGITRQAVHRHLAALVEAGLIEATGKTRRRSYALKVTEVSQRLALAEHQDEDRVWRTYAHPLLCGLPENVLNICHHGFTEMFNNAIDHSEGAWAIIVIQRSARRVSITIDDDGVGIFEKLRARFGLDDRRHAILELAKGKLTTDPARHSGEGIFFTSRIFDRFWISSEDLFFLHDERGDDWLIENLDEPLRGTLVGLEIAVDSRRTAKEVFDRYAGESEDFAFSRTRVPVALARYGSDQLVSRSQAKRVLARFDRFREVILDFSGVESIGRAFADEIFRVFRSNHPDIKIVAVDASEQVARMIQQVQSIRAEPPEAGPA